MTTIAWDGKTLAADSQMTRSGIQYGEVNKIVKLSDGRYFACCGKSTDTVLVVEWLNERKPKEKPEVDDGFAAIIVDTSTGVATELYYDLIEDYCPPIAAQGSGWHIALTAMTLGKSAVEAVETAIQLDVYSGGKVNFVRVGREDV